MFQAAHQLDKTITMKLTLAIAALLLAVPKHFLLPSLNLLSWLGFAIIIDLATGVWKSVVNKQDITSKRLQETVNKVVKYFGAIVVSFIIRNVVALHTDDNAEIMDFLGDSLLIFLVYIEVVSILENLIALDRKDLMTRAILIPLHSILTFHIFAKFKTPTDEQKDAGD